MLYALAALPLLVLFAIHWTYSPLLDMTDYAQYLMQADAFLRGEGLTGSRYIYTALNPMYGPPAYPPGFPLTLAGVLAMFGASPVVLKLFMLACLIGFAALAARYFEKREGIWMGLAVFAMCTVALEAAYATQATMSDLGFALIVWALLLIADRDGEWSLGRVVAITVLGLAAMSYRAAGLVLVPAVLLFALVGRSKRGYRPFVPVAIWVVLLGVGSVLLSGAEIAASVDERAIWRIPRRLLLYRFSVFQGHLYPWSSDVLNDLYHVGMICLSIVGLVEWLRRSWRGIAAIFSVAYVGMLFVVWAHADRYLWPVYPVLIFGALNGARVVAHVVWRRAAPERIGLAVAGGAAVLALIATITAARRPRPAMLLELPDVQSVFERVSSLRNGTEPRVVFVNPRVIAWETGVPAMGIFPGTPERIMRELDAKRITHVILGDLGLLTEDNAFMRDAVRSLPDRFALEFRNASFEMYRVRQPPDLTSTETFEFP